MSDASADWLVPHAAFTAALPDDAAFRIHYGIRHGTMRIGLYAPRGIDPQGPHKQDELYIVASGSGEFVKAGERRRFGPQDVIFVEAGIDHRFENFTDDFAAWVVFWGPEGGERQPTEACNPSAARRDTRSDHASALSSQNVTG